MCVNNDSDVSTIWNEIPRRARVSHQCDGCRVIIQPGEAYMAHSSLYDGHWCREAMCFGCWWVREAFGQAHHMFPVPSALIETLRECIDADGRESQWRPELASVLRRQRVAKHQVVW